MKYSIATILTVIAVVAVPSVDAVVGDITGGNEISSVSSSEPLHVSRNAATSRNGGTGRHKKRGKSDKSKNYVGDCSALSFGDFEIATGWEVDSEVAYTYPCSGGYVTNFAANDQLLKDVRGAINERGRDLGINADCANLCDVDNGSYKLVGKDTSNEAVTGQRSIAEVYPRKIAEIFCDEEFGVLNNDNPFRDDAFNTGPNNDLNACRCDPDDELGGGKYISGCYECEGVLTFSVKSCLDSSDFSKSAKDKKLGWV